MTSKKHHATLRQDREERERKAKRGEIPNHSSLANPISLLPHGWAIDYDHSRSTTVWRHFWHSPPFPIAMKERSTVPFPFPIPVPPFHTHSRTIINPEAGWFVFWSRGDPWDHWVGDGEHLKCMAMIAANKKRKFLKNFTTK